MVLRGTDRAGRDVPRARREHGRRVRLRRPRFIKLNRELADLSVADAFTRPETASHGGGIQHDIYRPIRTILFAAEYALFASERDDGEVDYRLGAWHFVSVLLHAINALLVLMVLRTLLRGAVVPAAAGALLFALHPITSESVAWLSSQGDLLAMTFLLAALLVLEKRGAVRTAAGAVLFALAAFSKESALVLPALLVLRDVALPRDNESPSPWARTTWIRAGILAAVAVLYFLIRHSVLPGLAQVDHPGGEVTATARAMLSGLGWYAGALLWPAGFSFDTRIDIPYHWTDPEVVVGLGILFTTIAAGVFGLLRRHYVLAFATLGFLVMLGPVSNVIVPLKTFVADRFVYPGLLCVAAGLGALLYSLKGTTRVAVCTVALASLAVFGVLSSERNDAWASEKALWDAVRKDRPSNANAYQGLAYEYGAEGRIAEAERAMASYLEANPGDGKSLFKMGELFGRVAESVTKQYSYGPKDDTSHGLRVAQARAAQIRLYQRALGIWDQPGGLLRGRGSELMRYQMLDNWIAAALDLGDVRSAKFANDRFIDLDARDPETGTLRYTHRDTNRVMTEASWWRRRARMLIALRAIQATRTDKPVPKDLRAKLDEDRRLVIFDIGLDPNQPSQALLGPISRLIKALIDEAKKSSDLVPDPGLYLHRHLLLMGSPGGHAEAGRVLEEGLRVHPGQPALENYLRMWRQIGKKGR